MACLNQDRHHVIFTKKEYRSGLEKQFRQHPLLKVLMNRHIHQDLHDNVEAPPKPNREIMLGSLAMLMSQEDNPDQVDALTNYAAYLTEYRGKSQELAGRIGENLFAQLEYIEAGIIEPVIAMPLGLAA